MDAYYRNDKEGLYKAKKIVGDIQVITPTYKEYWFSVWQNEEKKSFINAIKKSVEREKESFVENNIIYINK